MTALESTAECVRKHEESLREVYELYSVGVDGIDTPDRSKFSERYDEEQEMWALACTLVGVPTKVCGVLVVENYRNGNPIGFRTRSNVSIDIYREFRMLKSILYAKHCWQNIDASPYRKELSEEFDLRRTGQLGVAIIDFFDKEIVDVMSLEEVSNVAKESSNQLITNRNMIFEVSSTNDLLYSFETGGWDESRYVGINEARVNNIYWGLRRAAIQPLESSVSFASKNKLRCKKDWNDED